MNTIIAFRSGDLKNMARALLYRGFIRAAVPVEVRLANVMVGHSEFRNTGCAASD
ncbi:MAG: hypothetical protein KDI42_09840 [Gammaproteobacteria bacterium]|nr:hypothetical protein [Gammaproteobacteria bacterium]